MRILIAIPALAALAACNVNKNGNEVSVQYDQNTAENTAAAVGNTAQDIANDIGSDVKNTGAKIENKVGNSDVKLTVDKHDDNKAENKTDKK